MLMNIFFLLVLMCVIFLDVKTLSPRLTINKTCIRRLTYEDHSGSVHFAPSAKNLHAK